MSQLPLKHRTRMNLTYDTNPNRNFSSLSGRLGKTLCPRFRSCDCTNPCLLFSSPELNFFIYFGLLLNRLFNFIKHPYSKANINFRNERPIFIKS